VIADQSPNLRGQCGWPAFQRARQPKQIEQRREAILQAALVLFQKKGFLIRYLK
jgi:peptide methionine sulfoxide reductase MsrB